jgi:photosystem II stability/assembly factor-like uncharacterized protein
VTITGLLFADTPAGNTVRFGGAQATVLSASATSLVAVVPGGATTGKIQVTTAGGTATSSGDFTVLVGLGAAWTTRLAGPFGTATGLAHTGARFVAVGSDGAQSSPDGLVWTLAGPFSRADDVAWDGALLVSVGGASWVNTSPDGLAWTLRFLPAGARSLNAVAHAPALWVAVGDGGYVASSPDGITWTGRTSGTPSDLRSVTWTGSRFVAVGADGAVVTSPDGLAWTLQPAPTTDSFTAVGSSPSLVVATTFPYSGSTIALLTSPDGATWTPVTPAPGSFNRILYAGGRFVGGAFYSASTSPDGLAWTTRAGVPGILDAIVHTGAGYLATGDDGQGAPAAFSSSDGLAWSMRAAGHRLTALARRPSDGLLLTVGSNTARTSADGGVTWALDWLSPDLGKNYPFLDVVWSTSATAFVALVQVAANQDAYTSADGRTWTRAGSVPCLGGLAVSPAGLLLATGGSSAGACVATSPDGVTWTTGTPPAGGRLDKAFWIGGQFLGVGATGALATSPDGATWTPRVSGVTGTLRGAAASPSTQVVVGDGGTILTSADGGATWTPRTSGTSSTLRRVTWTGTEFLAVGSAGRLLRSPDGVAWTSQPTPYASPTAHDLNDVLFVPGAGGRLVLVGSDGLVATSAP